MHKSLNLTDNQLGAVYAYLFRRIDVMEFRRLVPDGIATKARIDRSGYILKNCKLFAYAYHKAKLDGTRLPKPKEFNVKKEDARLLRRLNLSHIPSHYRAMTLAEFNQVILDFSTNQSVKDYTQKFISRKLMFLIRSYGDTRHDLTLMMYQAALYNIYRVYPFIESQLHVNNVGRSAISRSGHTRIKQRTSAKHQRLLRNADGGFESVHVPLYDVHEVPQGRSALPSIEDLNVDARVRRFLELLAGQYDPEFSAYLGENNAEAAETMVHRSYRAKLQAFMQVTPAQVNRVFQQIRERGVK